MSRISFAFRPGIVGVMLVAAACGTRDWGVRASRAQKAEAADSHESRRKRAMELYEDHKHLEALPLLETLVLEDPQDYVAQERLAFALVTKAVTLQREDARKARLRARAILVHLKTDRPLSDLGNIMLEGIPPDGRFSGSFSPKKEIDKAMRDGEAAFAHRDFAKALAAYELAYQLDPKLYSAALFSGDVYFAQRKYDQACKWFARAVSIDPDHATAYRYWGDALSLSGKKAEARSKFLEAIVAEPYSQRPWMSLAQWARGSNVTISHPRVQPEGPPAQAGAGQGNEGLEHLDLYGTTRTAWSESLFEKTFPNEPEYRHSLPEEADALRKVAEAVARDLKSGKIKTPNPVLANLVKLNDEGLLEAYVLLARPDDGIARDYISYRAKHLKELKRYLSEYVAPFDEPKPGN